MPTLDLVDTPLPASVLAAGALATARFQLAVPALRARLAEEWRFLRAWRELARLDDRDLDDLALGRADLPALARRHTRGEPPRGRR